MLLVYAALVIYRECTDALELYLCPIVFYYVLRGVL